MVSERVNIVDWMKSERYGARVWALFKPGLGFREKRKGECCLQSHAAGDRFSQRCRNLVDPASSHMLVSKIKPCMSKFSYLTVKPRMAH